MKSHLLGKPVPEQKKLPPPPKPLRLGKFAILAILPIAMAGSFLVINQGSPSTAQRDISRTLGITSPAPSPVGSCKNAATKLKTDSLFPIFPEYLRDFDHKTDGCVPSLWTKEVFVGLLYKTLGILNYIAGALAVLATLYAGVLYLSSYGRKQVMEKARNILIGTYVGFAIVLGARLIVQGSFFLFGQTSDLTEVLPND